MTDEENKTESGHDDIMPPTGSSGSGNTKWIAIIIVLIVIISGLALAYALKPTSTTTTAVAPTPTTTTTTTGTSYSFAISNVPSFNYLNVYYGDGATKNVTSSSSTLSLQHTYNYPGSYLVYYNGQYKSSNAAPYGLVQILPPNPTVSQYGSIGFMTPISDYSTNTVGFSQNVYTTNSSTTNVSLAVGYYTPPLNTSYSVYGQSAIVTMASTGGSVPVVSYSMPYSFNASTSSYTLTSAGSVLNLTNLASGYYQVELKTLTGIVNPTSGIVSVSNTTISYYDFAVFSYSQMSFQKATVVNTVSGTFMNAELETGGFRTLDPQLAYDTVSDEILSNTYETLTTYQGSNSGAYAPYLASALPNTTNGGVNTHYHNYTVTPTVASAGYSAPAYAVNVTPGENYTFHIRSAAEFQNGTPVTAWDVMYSLTRDLLFTANAANPGWIIAQYILPGNYYASGSFWNITQNMTVNNATNSITIHFQHPMPEALVNQIFFASGTYITSASWLQQQGAGITWTPTGFQQYELQGNPSNWNTKVQFAVDASGPYQIFSESQNSQVVLEANSHFTSPNKWVLAPSIKFIDIKYIASPSTTYLLLQSGQAQSAGIPSSSWNLVQGLIAKGTVYSIGSPTLDLFWYNFNANVNVSMTKTTVANANLPNNLFVSLHARRAFSYAYNETNYLNNDVGNAVFNTTFAQAYAGMLPQGMLGYQNMSQLNQSTNGAVPYYNLQVARADWNYTMAHDGAKLGLSMSGGKVVYNGSSLVIPIYIFSADPVDLSGATTWAKALASVIPGASFPVEPTAFPTLIGNGVQGANPMPVWLLGWAPDYPFPTDYLGPMALPVNSSTYPGPNDFNPWYFGNNTTNSLASTATGQSQSRNLTEMTTWYYEGALAISTTTALHYFHLMNNMLINMSFYTYVFQAYSHTVISSKINEAQAKAYQLNTMWVGAFYMYNDLTYS
ncbi:MAG: ABC transporter substrate-binding protein [Thermoplasmataceae archaeon]